MPATFTTIDLSRHEETCVQFRRDSYRCSFPDGDERFDRENGRDGGEYIRWLRERIAEFPEGCVHVWKDGAIAGQMEMRVREESKSGYVFLFYITPEMRGSGIGDELQRYALEVFRKRGMERARLSVGAGNARAMAYYRKHGWVDIGPRPDHPEARIMEITIT